MDLDVHKIIRCIREGNGVGVLTQLQEFNKEYAQCFFFDIEESDRRKQRQLEESRKNKVRTYVESEFDSDDEHDEKDPSLILRQNLAAVLVRFIRAGVKSHLLRVCLVTLRILSRDMKVLGPLLTDSALLTLTRLAGLTSSDSAEDSEPDNYEDIITALAEAKQAHNSEMEDDEEDDECFTLGAHAKSDFSNSNNNGDPEGCGGCGSQPASVNDTHRGSSNHRALQRGRKDRRESKKMDEEEDGDEDRVTAEELRKEAMKVLCNMMYNSTWAQERFSKLRILSDLTERLSKSAYCLPPSSVQFYELRLMFLMTALRPELRVQLQQAGGVSILTATLEHCLEIEWKNQYEAVLRPAVAPISFEASQRAVEILKILFNITHSAHSQELEAENADLYRHLVAVLRLCMMRPCELTDDTDELQGHSVNLLSAVPLQCLDVLLSIPPAPDSRQSEGVNMDCVHLLLDFMERRLELEDKMKENLTPVLNLLIESCRAHRETRRYVRNHILPPLRDVSVRPEEGSTVKSRLIRLMTHVDTDLKHCAADLIFVLCKENVSRFVKYTGYGNAAGLLATRGLLGGERPKGSSSTTQYSSDSDSDTEEYRQLKGRVNPVTGRVEAEQPDPMEGMTEEEKEEEAQRLVTLFSKLSRENIIQPMELDAEGKLVPMSGLRNTLLAEEEESGADSDTEADERHQE